jgi:molecular chaperone GrpE
MKGEKKDFEVEISTEGKEKSSATSVDQEREEPKSKSKKLKVKDLKEDLKEKEEEIKALNDTLLRSQAEFENYKKRITKEKSDLLKYANEELVKEMLRTVDNLEMAIGHAREANQSDSITEGIEIVLKHLLQSLERFGVTGFTAVGEKFDPNRHEAVIQVESAEHESNTVIAESQKGYFLRDRLLRPSLVTVTKMPPADESEE